MTHRNFRRSPMADCTRPKVASHEPSMLSNTPVPGVEFNLC
ncbi:hypothetical protein BZL30_4760 [Mycobacterium kansasii]|uniref:Uncharacterized protein n=1 Tax=Mycobacterium kansasii TaxID=1768 RepID=A0A1V3X3W6_MYCKA|nr:hypothetical protein BZL30_4760 [Mycobacterium kansasii]